MSKIDCDTSIDEEYVGYFVTEVANSVPWLGREVSQEEFDDLSPLFKDAIQKTLDAYDEESEEFYRLTVTLEEIGDTVDEETIEALGLRQFVELVIEEEDKEEFSALVNKECGFWSDVAKFFKKNKKVLLIGAAVVIASAVIIGTAGAASAAAAGGMAAANKKKKPSPPPAVLPLPPVITAPSPVPTPISPPIVEGFPLTASAPVYTPPTLLPEFPSFTPKVSLTNNNAPYLPTSSVENSVSFEKPPSTIDLTSGLPSFQWTKPPSEANVFPFLDNKAVDLFPQPPFILESSIPHVAEAQTTPYAFSSGEFAWGFIQGIPSGLYESGKGWASLLYHLATGSPTKIIDQTISALNTLVKLAATAEWDALSQAIVPEARELVKEWDGLPSDERGKRAGNLFARYGTDMFLPGTLAKLSSKGIKGAQALNQTYNALRKVENYSAISFATVPAAPGHFMEILNAQKVTTLVGNTAKTAPIKTPPAPVMVVSPPLSGAYITAKNGGKHAGFLAKNIHLSINELKTGIASFDKQISHHRNKIASPEMHIVNWEILDPRQKDALINKKWPSDIKRLSEQREILRGILHDRK